MITARWNAVPAAEQLKNVAPGASAGYPRSRQTLSPEDIILR